LPPFPNAKTALFAWISKYGLEDDTVDFIGHALALHRDDNYLDEPAIDTVKRMKVLYFHQLNKKLCWIQHSFGLGSHNHALLNSV
jgi:RAB protein geranylgeranyltransferase component A